MTYIIRYAYVHQKINDIFIMGLILMHRYPKTILLKYRMYSDIPFLEMFSADPVNDSIVVIKYVMSNFVYAFKPVLC